MKIFPLPRIALVFCARYYKKIDKKGEIKVQKLNVIQTLKTGVKVYDLSDIVEVDHAQAQDILDNGDYTNVIDSDSAYSERIDNGLVGVYECMIDSKDAYNRFADLLIMDGSCANAFPSFSDWMTNKIERGRTKQSLVKWMKKEGVSQDIIDFYSSQLRTDKERYYFTISDLPQHIVSMSLGVDWDSCQHPDREEAIRLGGSLYDDSLVIGMLHKRIEDLHDMEDMLLARVLFRVVRYEGATHLVPSTYYGSVDSKEVMDRCIRQLEELSIHSKHIRFRHGIDEEEDMLTISQEANGAYDMVVFDDIHVYEEIRHSEEIECPMCNGYGMYGVTALMASKDVEIDCPMCKGLGVYKIVVECDIDEVIEVESPIELLTHNDDYTHDGNRVFIDVSYDKMVSHLKEYVW